MLWEKKPITGLDELNSQKVVQITEIFQCKSVTKRMDELGKGEIVVTSENCVVHIG